MVGPTIFSDTERTPNPDFKVTTIFDAEYVSNATRYMIVTLRTHLGLKWVTSNILYTHRCNFE